MDKETFALQYDTELKMTYVKMKDGLTKNHKDTDIDVISGFMPQVLGPDGLPHKLCPIRSFKNYTNLLNPNLKSLWQTPMKKFSTDPSNLTSYKCVRLGHNTLDKFLLRLSKTCNLSDYYTNHCLCVTGITTFKRSQCTDSQIMAVSGHKSIQSFALYQ